MSCTQSDRRNRREQEPQRNDTNEQKLEGKAGGMWIPGSKVFQVKGKGSVTPWDEAMFEVSEDREEGD